MSELDLRDARRVHLVGIGGSGMSALAMLLRHMGRSVTGSDIAASPTAERLRAAGIDIRIGHAAANVDGAEYVIRSSAVRDDNVEVVEAERRGLPTRKLAQAVGELMRDRQGVAIAGTHGKTTTTSLVAWLLEKGGADPLVLIGADTPAFPLGARVGDGPMVVEADEYDRRFLEYWPEVALVTSVEADHLDYYHDLAEIRGAFESLTERLPADGRLIVCADEPCAASLTTPRARKETYGFADDADWHIGDYAATSLGGASFSVRVDGREWAVNSPLVGEHNACNVAGAMAVAEHFGIGLRASLAAIQSFEGPRRRFQTKGLPRQIRVVDDYGHHPTEVAAVLRAARSASDGDVWVVFQPHTTNRTSALLDEFGRSFGEADHALILPIYLPSGREAAARPVRAEEVVERVRANGHPDVRFVPSFDAAQSALVAGARPGDVVITMGAGDVTLLSDRLLEALAA